MKRNHTGFTLIEMMISIVLGIIIIFGIGQIFVATRTSFSAQQGLSHVQQSGRFAMEFIGAAVRSAGDMGFSNNSSLMQASGSTYADPQTAPNIALYQVTNASVAGAELATVMDFAVPLTIHEWIGSSPGGTVSLPENLIAGGDAPSAWDPPIPQFVADRAITGSDIIVARYSEARSFQIRFTDTVEIAPGVSAPRVCAPGGIEIGVGTTGSTSGIPSVDDENYSEYVAAKPKRLVVIGQHDTALVAQASILSEEPLIFRTFGGVGFPANYTDPARRCGPFGMKPPATAARIGMARVDIFYIGVNQQSGEPGLWRLAFDGSDGIPFAAEELVEGVENLQILGGIAMKDGLSNTSNRPDRYLTGAEIDPNELGLTDELGVPEEVTATQRRIIASRISLLVRSENFAAGQVNELDYAVAGTTIDPFDDRRLRQVYEQTMGIRNRERLLRGSRDAF